MLSTLVLFVVAVFGSPDGARANSDMAPRVLICGSPLGGNPWNADVQSKLTATGRFSLVDVFNSGEATPSLALLQQYDAVLAYTDRVPFNTAALSSALASYVSGGGKVVAMVFGVAQINFGPSWTDKFRVIPNPGEQMQGQAVLGSVPSPSNEIMRNVRTFNGGDTSYRSPTNIVLPESTVVAYWSDDRVFAALRFVDSTCRIDLNFYPVSSAVRSNLWVQSTDGALLMANALTYIARNCPGDLSSSPTPTRTQSPVSHSKTATSSGSRTRSLTPSASPSSSVTPSHSPSSSKGPGAVVLLGSGAPSTDAYVAFEDASACRGFVASLVRQTNCALDPYACARVPLKVAFQEQCALPVPILRGLTAFHQLIVGANATRTACRATNANGALCFDAHRYNVMLYHDTMEACLSDFENIVVRHALVGQFCRARRAVMVTRATQPPNDTGMISSVTNLAFANLTAAAN